MLAIRRRAAHTTLQSTRTDLRVFLEPNPKVMAHLQQRTTAEMQQRFDEGHRAYIAWLDDDAAAWGWVATRHATIGELHTTLQLPQGWRYLWNFVTAPAYRGRGIYPHLLGEILEREIDAETFLIAYAPENHASASGIRKAGFEPFAELSFDAHGTPAFQPVQRGAESFAGALSLPIAMNPLTPCWKCVRAGRSAMHCTAETCRCDYQRKEQDCAAVAAA